MQTATEVYTCKPSTRIVTPLCGDVTTNRFLMATANIDDNNEIHLVEYNTRTKSVYSECIYKHEGQIFGLSPCPYDPELCFAIVGCDSDTKKGILYRLNNLPTKYTSEEKDSERETSNEKENPTEIQSAPTPDKSEGGLATSESLHEGDAKKEEKEVIEEDEAIADDKKVVETPVQAPTELSVLATAPRDNVITAIWHPGNLEEGTLPHEMLIVYRTGYAGYQVTDAGALTELFFYPFKEVCTAAAWDPLHTHLLALAHDCDIKIINISNNSILTELPRAHADTILCMEYNPNRPSILCTGGKDGVVTIWHVSQVGLTIEKTFQAHSHWVTSVHFNPLHDQLVLTTSTDSSITVWRLFTVSSAHLREKQHEDKLVLTLGGTRTSVYSSCWSAKNMWLFCAASYEGKLLFGTVPEEEVAVLLDEI